MVTEFVDFLSWVWKTWNVHLFVLGSLLLQFILFFAAPLRQKTSTCVATALTWCAYQLVDTVVTHTLSTIRTANSTIRTANSTIQTADKTDNRSQLYFLWAIFMFLHKGGPDTITAQSHEDITLWRRGWFNFGVQAVLTSTIALGLYQSNDTFKKGMVISTGLIFFAGAIKVWEKNMCLKIANIKQSSLGPNPNPGPDYAAIVEEYNLYKDRGVPVEFVEIKDPAAASPPSAEGYNLSESDDVNLLRHAHRFYIKFKGTYDNQTFCCHDRFEDRDFILKVSPEPAFRILEMEMKFAYESFYTKHHMFDKSGWLSARLASFLCEIAAMSIWFRSLRPQFRSLDALVTSLLHGGALLMDTLAFVRLYLSNWGIASGMSRNFLISPFLYIGRRRWGELGQDTLFHSLMRYLFRQWSESISQFNFINYCINERPHYLSVLYKYLRANDLMDGVTYVSSKWLTNNLKNFIFEELKRKSSIAEKFDMWDEVNSSRGSWVMRCSLQLDPDIFEPWISDVEFDESLLMWHIATELLYETGEMEDLDSKEKEHRTFSKDLSDYVLYLALRQPMLISEMAPMADVIFRDTSEEARQLFRSVMASSSSDGQWTTNKIGHNAACRAVIDVDTDVIPPGCVKGDKNNSVLFEACKLAKKLTQTKEPKKCSWELISQIWVELLCHAAAESPGSVHAVLLTQGGELVTLVRLLMLHLGLSNRFRKAKNTTRKELVVDM